MYTRYVVSWTTRFQEGISWIHETTCRTKQEAIETAQAGALNQPGIAFRVQKHYINPKLGICDIKPLITYWSTGRDGLRWEDFEAQQRKG